MEKRFICSGMTLEEDAAYRKAVEAFVRENFTEIDAVIGQKTFADRHPVLTVLLCGAFVLYALGPFIIAGLRALL